MSAIPRLSSPRHRCISNRELKHSGRLYSEVRGGIKAYRISNRELKLNSALRGMKTRGNAPRRHLKQRIETRCGYVSDSEALRAISISNRELKLAAMKATAAYEIGTGISNRELKHLDMTSLLEEVLYQLHLKQRIETVLLGFAADRLRHAPGHLKQRIETPPLPPCPVARPGGISNRELKQEPTTFHFCSSLYTGISNRELKLVS